MTEVLPTDEYASGAESIPHLPIGGMCALRRATHVGTSSTFSRRLH